MFHIKNRGHTTDTHTTDTQKYVLSCCATKNLQNIQKNFELQRNMKRIFVFMFEDLPDTDGVVSEENTEEAAAIGVEGKEADVCEKRDEGNKSMKIDLNDLFIKYCF